jgi:hypothetical protein
MWWNCNFLFLAKFRTLIRKKQQGNEMGEWERSALAQCQYSLPSGDLVDAIPAASHPLNVIASIENFKMHPLNAPEYTRGENELCTTTRRMSYGGARAKRRWTLWETLSLVVHELLRKGGHEGALKHLPTLYMHRNDAPMLPTST